MTYQRFEDVPVWQKAAELYELTEDLLDNSAFQASRGFRDQIDRASLSVSNNIAEGFERRSRKEYLNFLNIAKASAGETRSLLYVALEVGYIERDEMEDMRGKARFLSGSISNHMKAIAAAEKVKE